MFHMPVRLITLLSTLCFCAQGLAIEPLWLSASAPHAKDRGGHGHGGPVEVRKGIRYKRLWLREGGSPEGAEYVTQASQAPSLVLIDTAGKLSQQPLQQDDPTAAFNLSFPMPQEGFYNAYVEQRLVQGDRLEVRVAKAEVMKHSCREGHDNVQEKMPPRHHAGIPLEIVRERLPREDFHTRLGHGDEVSFTILRNGAPLADAQVTLTSGQGWSKQLLSDEQGRVNYTMIRDYYPPWSRFEKRHAQPYLVEARYTLPEAGEFDGLPYRNTSYLASYSGSYYPSPDDYMSYAYGLSFGLFAMVSTGGGIYFFRRRRKRPYREVGFDD
jgi:hypothetical protein